MRTSGVGKSADRGRWERAENKRGRWPAPYTSESQEKSTGGVQGHPPTSTCGGTGAGQARRRRRRGGGGAGSKMPIAGLRAGRRAKWRAQAGCKDIPPPLPAVERAPGKRGGGAEAAGSKVEGTGGVQGHPPTSTCGGTGAGQARRWRRGGGGWGGEQNADSGLRARRRAKWRAQAGCKDIPPPLPAVERAPGKRGGGAEAAGVGGEQNADSGLRARRRAKWRAQAGCKDIPPPLPAVERALGEHGGGAEVAGVGREQNADSGCVPVVEPGERNRCEY
ncbi:hypothetical protein C8F04DRAFT_1194481 [Mycena alexandri]|uniref:Uncharacterized protein n=1 Tax=Mycena alexandri TaxID=1745969 RepID=A0AAD6S7U8_9AGAR|nr:hypothetical protein C8F04DRAFT_1194481 [Mycena alexandri]